MLLKLGYGMSAAGGIFIEMLSGFFKVNATDSLLINNGGDRLIIKTSA